MLDGINNVASLGSVSNEVKLPRKEWKGFGCHQKGGLSKGRAC